MMIGNGEVGCGVANDYIFAQMIKVHSDSVNIVIVIIITITIVIVIKPQMPQLELYAL